MTDNRDPTSSEVHTMQSTVVIDPGHGGTAKAGGSSPNNAVGPNGLLEKDVTLDIGRRAATLLAGRANVILTRTGDDNRSLAERARIAHDANADVFLSIHLNGWRDPGVDGSEAWVARGAATPSRELARTVLDKVASVTQARNRGVREENFGVLLTSRHAPNTAATLVEVAFLTNPAEAERLGHEEYRQAIAQAIADGVSARLAPQNGAAAQALATTAQQEAIDIVNAFRAETTPGSFTTRRDDVADRAIQLINDPTLVEQGALNLCGPAAVHRLWIARDPKAFARYVTTLYDTGTGMFGTQSVHAGGGLRDQDYYGKAVPAMAGDVCPSADWVAMSSLRDSSNTFLDFEGMPDEDFSAMSTPGDVAGWLRATGMYADVSDEGNWFFTKGIAHAEGLTPDSNTDIAMLINAHILTSSAVAGHKKSDEFILKAFPNHFVVLLSRVTEPTPDEVEFDCWTWGKNVHVRLRKDVFAPNYYGAVIARVTVPVRHTSSLGSGGTIALSGAPRAATGTIFLAPNVTNDYTDYIQPVTRGDAEPLINGRSTNPPSDKTEPLDLMQAFVQTTTEGDSVYLAAWYFDPGTPLTGGLYRGALRTWGGLLAAKAAEGVKVRILQTDFDPIEGNSNKLIRAWMRRVDAWISALPAGKQDNLQYVVSLHPATFGAARSIWAGRTSINIGTHHQKFMVVKRGGETIAFCGGLDIESRKVPAAWSYSGLAAWHDIHVKLRGPIARDLEKEFALRWNRESPHSTVAPSPNPWTGYDTLPIPSPPTDTDIDAEPERQQEDIQMERTVSSEATFSAFTTNQDNVKQIYRNIVGAASSYLYLENQYFRSVDLADWIVAQGLANPSMPVIIVVVDVPEEGNDPITEQGNYLQHEFFDRIAKGLGSRAAFYTMTQRAVHSKFVLADDRYMTIGSANANERSFQLDSELNVAIDNEKLSTDFRKRLWAHNLGVPESTVASWAVADFIGQWQAVADANAKLAVQDMAGEGVVPWDYKKNPGDSHVYIPDYLAETGVPRVDVPDDADTRVADAGSDADSGTQVA